MRSEQEIREKIKQVDALRSAAHRYSNWQLGNDLNQFANGLKWVLDEDKTVKKLKSDMKNEVK